MVDQKGETFKLDDISGNDSEDDEEHIPANDPDPTDPTNRPHNLEVATASQIADARVNNQDLLRPKANSTANIHQFFEKDGNKIVCVECR
jgi:hypothetical protein